MNREVKFRAWDDGKMIYEKDICHLSLEDNDVYRLAKFFCNVRNDCKIMQYTGLKDKNGKEIYEGDILKFVGGTCDVLLCGIYAHQHHKPGQLLVVRRLESGYTLSMAHHLEFDAPNLLGNVGNYDLWNHARSFEVIGNIYQNPELLINPPLTKE